MISTLPNLKDCFSVPQININISDKDSKTWELYLTHISSNKILKLCELENYD